MQKRISMAKRRTAAWAAVVIALAFAGPGAAQAGPPRAESTSSTQSAPIQGLWVWKHRYVRDAEARTEMIEFCQRHGYNRLLVQVHRKGRGEDVQLRYPDGLRALVVKGAKHGIAVEALDGSKAMAMKKNWPHTLATLDLVLDFNRSLPKNAKLAGMHYDIEPYAMDAWDDPRERKTIMLDLLRFYAQARARINKHASDFTLAADIPFWYDNKTEPDDSCVVTFQGRTKNLHQHIQDLCDYVGIMSYRTRAVGNNSVTAVVRNELAYAARIGKTVTPALNTIEVPDVPTITFFGERPKQFWRVHNQVRDRLEAHPGFGGMLTHSYRAARNLLDRESAK